MVPWELKEVLSPGQPEPMQLPFSSRLLFSLLFNFALNSFHLGRDSFSWFFLSAWVYIAEASWTWPQRNWFLIKLIVSLPQDRHSPWHYFRSGFLDQSCLAYNTSVLVTTKYLWEYTSIRIHRPTPTALKNAGLGSEKLRNVRPFPPGNDIGVKIPATTKDCVGDKGSWKQRGENRYVPWCTDWIDGKM